MEKITTTNHSVCNNCGKWVEIDQPAVSLHDRNDAHFLCSEKCHSEHQANRALFEMTWGTSV